DPEQPVPHRLPSRDGCCLADEDDEGGLEGILGVVVAQMAAADAPHHRAVPVDEGGKGRVVAPIDVTTEQLAVAKPVTHHPANVLDHARRHVPPSISYLPQEAELIHDFSRRAPTPVPTRVHPRVSRRKQSREAPERSEMLEVAARRETRGSRRRQRPPGRAALTRPPLG